MIGTRFYKKKLYDLQCTFKINANFCKFFSRFFFSRFLLSRQCIAYWTHNSYWIYTTYRSHNLHYQIIWYHLTPQSDIQYISFKYIACIYSRRILNIFWAFYLSIRKMILNIFHSHYLMNTWGWKIRVKMYQVVVVNEKYDPHI